MSLDYDDGTYEDIKELVSRIFNFKFEENTPIFKHTLKIAIHNLKSADPMFFNTQKEIDTKITNLYEKIMFHGFINAANEFKRLYEKFIGKTHSREELKNRLNIVKLLFELSDSPTTFLASLPECYQAKIFEEEEQIDWGTYLQEGIERWSLPTDSGSDGWTDEENSVDGCENTIEEENTPSVTCVSEPDLLTESIANAEDTPKLSEKYYSSAQHTWFNGEYTCTLPESEKYEAQAAILWNEHLRLQNQAMVDVKQTSMVSEYKIVREVFWQLQQMHSGVAYKIAKNHIIPRDHFTIPSTRPIVRDVVKELHENRYGYLYKFSSRKYFIVRDNIMIASSRHEVFKLFLNEFMKYIEVLQAFREFDKDVNRSRYSGIKRCPNTYRSYSNSAKNIIRLTMKSIIYLETTTKMQDQTMTLIKLAAKCREEFKTIEILQKIHKNVVLNHRVLNPVVCSTYLLKKLHDGLRLSFTKLEQDVHLCLYLDTLYMYLRIIDKWLGDDSFEDEFYEFPIRDYNDNDATIGNSNNKTEDWQMNFVVLPLDGSILSDGFLEIVAKKVLQIGRNVHLLRLLGKLYLLGPTMLESLHEEFTNKVLETLEQYFESEPNATNSDDDKIEIPPEGYKYPAICPDFCKQPTEMDRLDNLIDVTDGFLMSAFSSYFVQQFEVPEEPEKTLYEKISQITKRTFPTQFFIENIFSSILDDRYTECGHLLKSVFKSEYLLDEHIEIVKHIFLFKNDMIFPFYRKLFIKIEKNSAQWGNDIFITSLLQDVLIDAYPEKFSNVTVRVKHYWKRYRSDPLKALGCLKIDHKIEWPNNIIIRNADMNMYKEMFYFILQIKWALFTLNHMLFRDIEPKGRRRKRFNMAPIRRLQGLRFNIINLFTSIQYYVLGYVFNKCEVEFNKDIENAVDLDTLIFAHSKFITDFYQMASFLRDYDESSYGIKLLLYLIRKLGQLWKNANHFDDNQIHILHKCELIFKKCQEKLGEILSPQN